MDSGDRPVSTQFFERQEAQRKLHALAGAGLHRRHPAGGRGHQPRGRWWASEAIRCRVLRQEPEVVFWISLVVLGDHPDRLLAQELAAARRRRRRRALARRRPGQRRRRRPQAPAAASTSSKRWRSRRASASRRSSCCPTSRHQRVRRRSFARRSRGRRHAGRARRARSRSAAGGDRPRVQSHPQRRHEDQHAADRVDLRPVRDHRSRAALHAQPRRRQAAPRALKLIAFGIFIAGSIGMLAGRLLQAAVSRRREHLADASAVQFTRNPQALQGAFIVDGGARRRHAARRTKRPSTSRTCSSPAATRRGRTRSAARGSPRIRRSKSACARSTRASRRCKFRTLVSDQRRKTRGAKPPAGRRSCAPTRARTRRLPRRRMAHGRGCPTMAHGASAAASATATAAPRVARIPRPDQALALAETHAIGRASRRRTRAAAGRACAIA